MRRITIVLVLGTVAALSSGTAFATLPPRSPSRAHRYRYKIVLKTTGNEYEDANGKVLNGTDATKCPPTRDVPSVKAKCWTWKAKHLGHGTYTRTNVDFQVGGVTWNFTFKDSRGDTLNGNAHGSGVVPDPTPTHTVGHVNRFPDETYTFTNGTGRFTRVTGVLHGEGASVVLSVDPSTGVAHKKGTDRAVGMLTFPVRV